MQASLKYAALSTGAPTTRCRNMLNPVALMNYPDTPIQTPHRLNQMLYFNLNDYSRIGAFLAVGSISGSGAAKQTNGPLNEDAC